MSPYLIIKYFNKLFISENQKYFENLQKDFLIFFDEKMQISHCVSIDNRKNLSVFFNKFLMFESKQVVLLHKKTLTFDLNHLLPSKSEYKVYKKIQKICNKQKIVFIDQIITDGFQYWSRWES